MEEENTIDGKMEERKSTFKKTEFQRPGQRAEEFCVKLRKKQKEEIITKKRMKILAVPDNNLPLRQLLVDLNPHLVDDSPVEARLQLAYDLLVPEINLDQTHALIYMLRCILSRDANPPFQIIVEMGFISKLLNLIQGQNTRIMQETAWCLTNLAATNSPAAAEEIVKQGGIEILALVGNTHANNSVLLELVLWTLANLAGESLSIRSTIWENNMAIDLIIAQMTSKTQNISTVRILPFCLSNLLRGNPPSSHKYMDRLFKESINYLFLEDIITIRDTLWCISYMTDADRPNVNEMMIKEKDPNIIMPAVRVLGNIAAGSERNTDRVIQDGLETLFAILQENNIQQIIKETLWSVSNITAGVCAQIDKVLCHNGLLDLVFAHISQGTREVKKEGMIVIRNILTEGTVHQVSQLVKLQLFESLIEVLQASIPENQSFALDIIDKILCTGEILDEDSARNRFSVKFDALGGCTLIEELQITANEIIYNQIINILQKYFRAEEVVENMSTAAVTAGLPPSMNNQQRPFNF